MADYKDPSRILELKVNAKRTDIYGMPACVSSLTSQLEKTFILTICSTFTLYVFVLTKTLLIFKENPKAHCILI